MNRRTDTDIEIGTRPDGAPWRIRVVEVTGERPGPRTAFVAGIWGDKPLAVMALWRLVGELSTADLHGTVVVIPAANPPAIAAGTRVNPDHLFLNRVFPGAPSGALTMQVAHAVSTALLERADCIVDVHSGTATMGLGYIYDYGDLELSSSFGFLPVVTGFAQPGQLSTAATAQGASSCLVEFGGGSLNSPDTGVEGCLNVLAHRGQIQRSRTGPASVPLIEQVSMYMPSVGGVLGGTVSPEAIGAPVPVGPTAWIDCPGTGERLDTFEVTADGGILLLANTTPLLVDPGAFACTVGYPSEWLSVPGHDGEVGPPA